MGAACLSRASGERLLSSGKTADAGSGQPTTHVSPPSAHCGPSARGLMPSSSRPPKGCTAMTFPTSCTSAVKTSQSGSPAARAASADWIACSTCGVSTSGSDASTKRASGPKKASLSVLVRGAAKSNLASWRRANATSESERMSR